ncbi:MAG: hypothetical protein M3251_01855 [Thermoproteota archaeon]|nr:hypothetical protein [Thermoproteota archaeon]
MELRSWVQIPPGPSFTAKELRFALGLIFEGFLPEPSGPAPLSYVAVKMMWK